MKRCVRCGSEVCDYYTAEAIPLCETCLAVIVSEWNALNEGDGKAYDIVKV